MSNELSVYVGPYFKVDDGTNTEQEIESEVHGCEKRNIEQHSSFCSVCGEKTKQFTKTTTKYMSVDEIIGEEDVFLVPEYPNNAILPNVNVGFMNSESGESMDLSTVNHQEKLDEFIKEYCEEFKMLEKVFGDKIKPVFGVVSFWY